MLCSMLIMICTSGLRPLIPPTPDPFDAVDMPDPTMAVEQFGNPPSFAYHLYGGGNLVKHMVSINTLSNWSNVDTCLARPAKWCSDGNGQAPSIVQRADGRWLLFTAGAVKGAKQQLNKCIGVAVSDKPAGPFEPVGNEPLVCQLDLGGSIDPSARMLTDGGGKKALFLHWKSNNAVKGGATGAGLWGQRLSDDGLSLVGDASLLVVAGPHGAGSSWNMGTTENPAVLQTGGKIRLFYSGSSWDTGSYAIGYADCSSPLGPCTDMSKRAPWLKSYNATTGPGGEDFFLADGMPWMVFHGWQKGHEGYNRGGERRTRAYPVSQLPPLR
jgi:hypothetical protein